MSSIDSSMTVGVFREEAQAQQALASLRSAGFHQVQFFQPGRTTPQSGGLFAGIKRLLAGSNEDITGKLTAAGVSEVDARYYQQEYAAGQIILAVRANERKQEALDILRDNDAYDSYTRNRKTTATETPTSSTPETALASQTETTPEAASVPEAIAEVDPASTDEQGTHADALSKPPDEDPVGVDDRQKIDPNGEQQNVSKEPVQTEEAKLHKDADTEQRTLDTPAPHEEAVVEEKTISIDVADTSGDATKVPPVKQGEEVRISGDRSPQGKRRQNAANRPHAKSRKKRQQ